MIIRIFTGRIFCLIFFKKRLEGGDKAGQDRTCHEYGASVTLDQIHLALIMEKGDHNELLALKGRYYDLYTGQSVLD